jgi:GxxExxY protein
MSLARIEADNLPFQCHVPVPVRYDEVYLDSADVADIIVAEQVILEIKSVEPLLPLHQAQLLT